MLTWLAFICRGALLGDLHPTYESRCESPRPGRGRADRYHGAQPRAHALVNDVRVAILKSVESGWSGCSLSSSFSAARRNCKPCPLLLLTYHLSRRSASQDNDTLLSGAQTSLRESTKFSKFCFFRRRSHFSPTNKVGRTRMTECKTARR